MDPMEIAARALFDSEIDPFFVGGNDWMTWDMLTDEGKSKFRERAKVAVYAYLKAKGEQDA